MTDLNGFSVNLRFVVNEIKRLKKEIPPLEHIDTYELEKFYNNLNAFYEHDGIKDILYGDSGKGGIERFIYDKKLSIEEGLKLYEEENSAFPKKYKNIIYKLLIYNMFFKHDSAIGRYELDQRHKLGRDITLSEAVEEYCKENNIIYEKEFLAHKIWKYQKDEIKLYKDLLEQEERIKSFISANIEVVDLNDALNSEDNSDVDPYATMLLKLNPSIIITRPIIYVHGAANEESFEGFYPDNEAIPEITKRYPYRRINVLFLPGSIEMSGQIQYFRKIKRYLLEKFNIQDVKAGIFACGNWKEFASFIEDEKDAIEKQDIFLLPSIEGKGSVDGFTREKLITISSKHHDFNREKHLKDFENYMNSCDIIYLGGGSSQISGLRYNHLKFSRDKTFQEALMEFVLRGGLLMGISAGAMAMGVNNITYTPKSMTLQSKIKGLKILPANVQVHFEEYGLMEHIDEIRKEFGDVPVVALDTLTAVLGKGKLKMIFDRSPYNSNYGWDLSALQKLEIIDETYTVMGLKTVTYNSKETEVLFDGMRCDLKKGQW
jgi:hypothetical protein